MKYLSLSIDGTPILAPSGIPKGGTGTGQALIQTGIAILFIVVILFTFFYMIQGGIQWMVSGGDKQRIEQARLKIVYAIVGLIISLGGFFILSFIFNLFGLSFK